MFWKLLRKSVNQSVAWVLPCYLVWGKTNTKHENNSSFPLSACFVLVSFEHSQHLPGVHLVTDWLDMGVLPVSLCHTLQCRGWEAVSKHVSCLPRWLKQKANRPECVCPATLWNSKFKPFDQWEIIFCGLRVQWVCQAGDIWDGKGRQENPLLNNFFGLRAEY